MKRYGIFINNNWEDTASQKVSKVINPATEESIAEVAIAEFEDVDRAVKAATAAFESGVWSDMSAMERGRILRKAADIIRERAEEFARTETMDVGKPIFESRNRDIPGAANTLEYYGSLVVDLIGKNIPVGPNAIDYTVREPIGVIGAIVPWNFPLVLACRKAAPALAAGNCMVMKPSSLAPLTTLMLGDVFKEAGLPSGVFNVVTGPGDTTGEFLLNHRGLDKLSFTGSTAVGRKVIEACAPGLCSCSLELGGKSPALVLADANIEQTIAGVLFGSFMNQAECCCAITRILIDRKIHDVLINRLIERTKKIKIGNGLDEDTQMGPLISAEHREKVKGYIQKGIDEGAKLVCGGGVPDGFDKGYFLEPTYFDEVTPDMTIYKEEVFGPVVAITSFDTVDELITAANDTPYGLAASIWTSDVALGHKLARKIDVGTVWINIHNFVFFQAPYGGVKQSGIGRELGREGLEMYTEVKNVITYLDSFNWYKT
jgi:acyl-CoA reductase-like NAD-dependent aldehyde dehydrogenase